jgi:hypothetical protein
VKDLDYVPKSKGNLFWTKVTPMITWVQDKITLSGDMLVTRLTESTRHNKLRKAYRVTKSAQRAKTSNNIAMMVFAAVAMTAQGTTNHNNRLHFDTGAKKIGINNRCTGCISHRIKDFDGLLVD